MQGTTVERPSKPPGMNQRDYYRKYGPFKIVKKKRCRVHGEFLRADPYNSSKSDFFRYKGSIDWLDNTCKDCKNFMRAMRNAEKKCFGDAIDRLDFKDSSYELYKGVDVKEIILHLGRRPTRKHEKDHIRPLDYFKKRIRKDKANSDFYWWCAWHKTNIQWLLDKKNRKKSNKCNVEEADMFIEKMKEIYPWPEKLSLFTL